MLDVLNVVAIDACKFYLNCIRYIKIYIYHIILMSSEPYNFLIIKE